MSEQPLNAREIMSRMPGAFVPANAQGVNTVIQYILTGEGGGDWHMTIADGACQVAEGRISDPKVTITMDAKDYVSLTTGRLDAIQAFMTGKVKLSGDFGMATRLSSFFQAPG